MSKTKKFVYASSEVNNIETFVSYGAEFEDVQMQKLVLFTEKGFKQIK